MKSTENFELIMNKTMFNEMNNRSSMNILHFRRIDKSMLDQITESNVKTMEMNIR